MQRDLGITSAVVGWVPEWAVSVFAVLTALGGLPLVVGALGWLYLHDLVDGIRLARRPLCPDRTAFIVAAVFGGLGLVVVLKSTLGLPRPPSSIATVPTDGFGFPSGHTMAATIMWGALAMWSDRWSRNRRLVVAGVIVALVGLSRVALGVHFAIDVVASVLLGGLYLLAVDRLGGGDPTRVFLAAIGISIAAILVTGASENASLALVGTLGAFVGWRSVERVVPSVLAMPYGR